MGTDNSPSWCSQGIEKSPKRTATPRISGVRDDSLCRHLLVVESSGGVVLEMLVPPIPLLMSFDSLLLVKSPGLRSDTGTGSPD